MSAESSGWRQTSGAAVNKSKLAPPLVETCSCRRQQSLQAVPWSDVTICSRKSSRSQQEVSDPSVIGPFTPRRRYHGNCVEPGLLPESAGVMPT